MSGYKGRKVEVPQTDSLRPKALTVDEEANALLKAILVELQIANAYQAAIRGVHIEADPKQNV